eukprot:m.296602 g.296602  ORF g.296602 m.296602 type:complete len:98 (+) comp20067_c0_seq2:165-458(+)
MSRKKELIDIPVDAIIADVQSASAQDVELLKSATNTTTPSELQNDAEKKLSIIQDLIDSRQTVQESVKGTNFDEAAKNTLEYIQQLKTAAIAASEVH